MYCKYLEAIQSINCAIQVTVFVSKDLILQICLVYINTLMIQSVLAQKHWQKRLTARDLQAITPLIFSHVNPYGLFKLDMKERIERLAQPLVA